MTKQTKGLRSQADFLVRGKNALNTVLYHIVAVIVVTIGRFINILYSGDIPSYRFLEMFAIIIGIYLVVVIVRYFIWGINNNNNSLASLTRKELIRLIKEAGSD